MRSAKANKHYRHQLVEHRRHTGRILPAGHTSYPALLFFLLIVGVLMAGLSFKAEAADVSVTASVAGPAPTQPAYITSPTNSAHVTNWLLPVSGTCPRGTFIELYRNNILNGSTLCTSNNTFSLDANLFWGQNQLQTHIFNLGNTEGPDSPIITVFLDRPPGYVSGSSSSLTGSGGQVYNPSLAPLLLQTSTSYQGFDVDDTVIWNLHILGGNSPYAISVDWGDGSTSVYSETSAGQFQISHIYTHVGGYHGNYNIKIKASDINGQQAYLQVFVLINSSTASAISSINRIKPNLSPPSLTSNNLRTVWSIYGVTILMTASFWLGERRGVLALSKRLKPSKQRPHHV